jgi:hypothetical protein
MDSKMKERIARRVVTHVLPRVLSATGFQKVDYYTQDHSSYETRGIYFRGMGINVFLDAVSQKEINHWVNTGQVIELPEPLNLGLDDNLFLNADGHLYIGRDPILFENAKIVLENFLSYKK